ncbi:MAG: SRPBCC domain-containing protein [Arcticibacter sp.]
MNTKLTAKAYIQIQKSPETVFESIINPSEMQNYFASGSDTLTSGQTVEWWFPEFPDHFPVSVKDVVPWSHISFDWSGGKEGMLVEINLEAREDGSTVVRIEEHEMDFSPEGVHEALQQTGGWANFLACLKAWLEYGVQLRKGAFDFLKPSP